VPNEKSIKRCERDDGNYKHDEQTMRLRLMGHDKSL
jgi:hypothetical protein